MTTGRMPLPSRVLILRERPWPPRAKAAGAALVLLSCFLGACSGKADGKKEEEEKKAVSVLAAPVRTASFVQKVRALGSTVALPNLLITVSPAVEGIVAEILVKEGDAVAAGQSLVRLDDQLAQRDLAERKAAQQGLDASLVLLKAPPRDQERKVAQLEVDRAQVAVALAQAVVARLVPLQERKEISEQEVFEAKQKLEDAKIQSKVAEARRDLLLAGARPEAIAEAEAKVVGAQAAVATASAHASYFVLSAPRAGTVNAVLCHQGQLLPLGAGAVELVDASEVAIEVGIPTRDASLIQTGQVVHVLTGDESRAVAGEVAYVGLLASPATGTVPVRVLATNPQGRLRLGTVVQVEIVIAMLKDELAVPSEAIISAEKEPELAVVRDGKVVMLHPRVGVRQGGLTQVTVEDLEPGELVITRGAYDLGEGTRVKVEAPSEESARDSEKESGHEVEGSDKEPKAGEHEATEKRPSAKSPTKPADKEKKPAKAEDKEGGKDKAGDKDKAEDDAGGETDGEEDTSTMPAVPAGGASRPT